MNSFFKHVEDKIKKNIKIKSILIIDNSSLHTKHKSFDVDKYHLKIEIESDYLKSLERIKAQREIMIKEHMAKQAEYNENIMKIQGLTNPNILQNKLNEQTFIIQQLSLENNQLKEKLSYLEDKIKQLISEKISYLKSKNPDTNM